MLFRKLVCSLKCLRKRGLKLVPNAQCHCEFFGTVLFPNIDLPLAENFSCSH